MANDVCPFKILFPTPFSRFNARPDVINNADRLNEFVATVKGAEWIALDTEADSLHAYPERLCLMQFCTPAGDELVDTLSGIDLSPLFDALSGHRILMHAADYDLRLLEKHHRFIPGAIFDTMLAARLLGIKQFGLGNLVEQFLGVKLEKSSQKANWAIRPLTPKMDRYARDDVRYLRQLVDKLTAELEAKQRLAWHQEWCARLIKDSTGNLNVDPDQVWRVKGCSLLGGHALAVLRELWKWREEEAIMANRPPFFILSHDLLVDIAVVAVNGESIETKLPRHLTERRRRGLHDAVRVGLLVPADEWPKQPERRGTRPNEAEKRRCFQLERKRDQRAKQLDIDPTLIASRSVLWELARHWDTASAELMNWQRELLA
ncbi:MAG: Ribonuclease [Verrucomicrobiota bacterium]